ncbi:unnamed protein product [Bathycoccus prasinos]
MCQTSKVDWTWKHTEARCTKDCILRIGKNRTPYYLNNVKTDEHGRPLGLSTLKRRKATRWGTDQAVIDFLDSEKKQGRGRGSILGISGSNYFDLFEHKSSTFTTADYPQVSCEDMPYLDNTFDYIICNQVLEHVSKPWLCVDEFHREHRWPKDNWRVLKDGMGVLLSEFSFREGRGLRVIFASIVHDDLEADMIMGKTITGGLSPRRFTVQWTAPEVLKNQPKTKETDVYSLAMTIWEIFERKNLYGDMLYLIVVNQILSNVRPEIGERVPLEFRRLVQKSWDKHAKVRPSAKQFAFTLLKYMVDVCADSSQQNEPVSVKEQLGKMFKWVQRAHQKRYSD